VFLSAPEFSALSLAAQKDLQSAANTRQFSNNQFVYLQEDDADMLYFIVDGHVRLSYLMEDGSAVLFSMLAAGEVFGELGVFEGDRYCDMATAVGRTTLACVPAGAYRTLGQRHAELAFALGRLVARRYRSYIGLTRDLSLRSLSARLAQSLLRLADGLGATAVHEKVEVACIGPIVTQTDLGLMARGARGNVNRILNEWKKMGLIAISDRSILILDRSRLEKLPLEEDFL
jgi:CRP/FNR family cyclic AMP-dependent transcriptional regulator